MGCQSSKPLFKDLHLLLQRAQAAQQRGNGDRGSFFIPAGISGGQTHQSWRVRGAGLLLLAIIDSGSPNFCLDCSELGGKRSSSSPSGRNTNSGPGNAAPHAGVVSFILLFFLLFTITHGEIFCVLHREKYSGELVKICPGCCWVCLCWEPLQS